MMTARERARAIGSCLMCTMVHTENQYAMHSPIVMSFLSDISYLWCSLHKCAICSSCIENFIPLTKCGINVKITTNQWLCWRQPIPFNRMNHITTLGIVLETHWLKFWRTSLKSYMVSAKWFFETVKPAANQQTIPLQNWFTSYCMHLVPHSFTLHSSRKMWN